MSTWMIGKGLMEYHSLEKMNFINNLKRVCKGFEKKKLGEYYHSHLQNNTLHLADVMENLKKMFLKINYLYLVKFISVLRSAQQAAFKKTEVKLEL